MKKASLFICLLFITVLTANPCTTFILRTADNGIYFGRTLDWVCNLGLVIVNQRGVAKQSMVPETSTPAQWVSTYGSITFNQFGKEFPFGGVNEKGLVVE